MCDRTNPKYVIINLKYEIKCVRLHRIPSKRNLRLDFALIAARSISTKVCGNVHF